MNVISIFKVGVLLLAPPARFCYHVKNHIDLVFNVFSEQEDNDVHVWFSGLFQFSSGRK